jgi:drug/metabolite transporter (DMT)-like permease
MNLASVFRLILLAALWGASFLFMRIGAPVLGPALLIFFRVGLAALFLLIVAAYLKKPLEVREHWYHFVVLGFFNTALPFLLFAFAARTVSASLLSILNATAPMWAAVIGAARTRTGLPARPVIGLTLGVAGVAVLAGVEVLNLPAGGGLAILAGLAAAFCYGIATNYARTAKTVEPFANAHGSMWAATLLLAPLALVALQPTTMPAPIVIGSVIALGVLCSGVAYLLYFRLISDIGATSALTVTYLIPVFGVLWGVVFLDEAFGWHTLAGGAMILAGTALVTGFSVRSLFSRTRSAGV